jgi:hypothetical protein|tara:strand:- start:1234 stop:1845 length:612 start_codon:yes stop_codon:yes gene_type:complete
MEVNHEDFIATYSNVYPDGYCRHLINEFERLKGFGAGATRQQSEDASRHVKDDYSLSPTANMKNMADCIENFDTNPAIDMFFGGLQACYKEYSSRYSMLQDQGNIRGNAMKMQKTDPGGGYHVWHCEQSSGDHANRVIVYLLYLNTLDEDAAGETEFLYQKSRFRPMANTMVLWPAGYTHVHRGNVVHGDNPKYIVTGWFYYE